MSVTYASTSFGTQLPQSNSQHSLAGSPGGRSSRQSFHSLKTYQNSIASESTYGVATTTDEHERPAPANHADLEVSRPPVEVHQSNVASSSSVETEAQKVVRLLAEKEAMDEAISQFFGGGRRKSTRVPVPVITEAEELEARAAPTRPSRISINEPRPIEVVPAHYDTIGSFFGFWRRSSIVSQPAPSSSVDNSPTQSGVDNGPVPPYSDNIRTMIDAESLPSYSKVEVGDMIPLNRKLFLYGFFFPPLWLPGMIMPFVTPKVLDACIDGRSKEEKDAEIAQLRVVEFRWALRCAAALLTLVILGAVAAILAVLLTRHK